MKFTIIVLALLICASCRMQEFNIYMDGQKDQPVAGEQATADADAATTAAKGRDAIAIYAPFAAEKEVRIPIEATAALTGSGAATAEGGGLPPE